LNISKIYSHLIDNFKKNQYSGEKKENLDLFIGRELFWGTIDYLVIRWLLKNRAQSLFDNLEHPFELPVEGFQTQR